MTKPHQAQRRRSYGRREREMRERRERMWAVPEDAPELGEESFTGMDGTVHERERAVYGSAYLGAD